MIYLASPYSHPDRKVQVERFEIAARAAADLMRQGHMVFSPITHSHPMAEHGLPGDFEYWEAFDRLILGVCDSLAVLMIDGFSESKGVTAEIGLAMDMGIPVQRVVWGVNGFSLVSDAPG